ncbi:Nucleotide-binding universal stress protein, UspA family [Jatrophihabitans endophyticus]|uniref:Nucleotide-binding universal stress protein, UspA family n=1 Tax=Jatrophihabitans endophyticus TaxID=1206085 RepID=A0A1M5PAY5_9ACTN|nr:universal stress protein [Jatrophihabitans endophyticus]SHG98930.1 Nucleotide-binding universal stress protein, UspA family [Jatrophihabitans endophyticus]
MTHTFELGTDGPTRILVGVDGSDTSLRAGAYAAGLARRQGAKLVVVFVRTSSVASGVAVTAGAMLRAQEDLGTEIRQAVQDGIEHVGIVAEYVERAGNPYRELIAVAAELQVDAIVVGASTQANHRIVGSLAARLVRDASWPVTVVP